MTPREIQLLRNSQSPPPPNYALMNSLYPKQKSALTRALNSPPATRRRNVIRACKAAVREWDDKVGCWPDDWSRWQRALSDVLGWQNHVDLRDVGLLSEDEEEES